MVFVVGVSCRILYSIVCYLYVSCSGSIPRLGKRELICLLSFTCNFVVSVRRGFLFLLELGTGCVILLWHSLVIPYNYLREGRSTCSPYKRAFGLIYICVLKISIM